MQLSKSLFKLSFVSRDSVCILKLASRTSIVPFEIADFVVEELDLLESGNRLGNVPNVFHTASFPALLRFLKLPT